MTDYGVIRPSRLGEAIGVLAAFGGLTWPVVLLWWLLA